MFFCWFFSGFRMVFTGFLMVFSVFLLFISGFLFDGFLVSGLSSDF